MPVIRPMLVARLLSTLLGVAVCLPASAVPVDAATRLILAALIRDGRVLRAYLGIVGGTRRLPSALAQRLGRPAGLEVVQLLDGSPAAAAGVRAGDLILSLDGRPIAGVGDLQRSLVGDLVGRAVEVTVERDGVLAEIVLTPVELRV